ncbi:zinc transporter ZIP13 isoform X1 [Electrophorus electricus]|uniref:Zinc transporter ZIP13 n=1 Tax=Electrophorus electricus TaxID=8005 RepID=A0A4W4E4T8_ELEEL|nr:zinc transporter ZIP13 isoform X1 [Electrophorus electricus]XP_026873476.2 zinc transporter ZIP13 isoform X1 [Electrophorus electricus]XP_026873477.2 zinc transporter ZIP13 isoform X1 [Electrophorus electricus]XP_035376703.1 zinc transporter ZIP13 isoform X1 [Electrophorus electricus]
MWLTSTPQRSGLMRTGPGRPVWALGALLLVAALLAVSSTASSSGKKMAQTVLAHATAAATGPGTWCAEEVFGFHSLTTLLSGEGVDVWLCSLVGSIAVGLSGIFPLLVIPIEAGAALKTEAGCQKLKKLLSFAIGGLLGDVFLHLLPEAWSHMCNSDEGPKHYRTQGLWVVTGLLAFLLLEKMFPDEEVPAEAVAMTRVNNSSTMDLSRDCFRSSQINGICSNNNSESKPKADLSSLPGTEKIKTSGYLNLLANCIDNFTHGLAVAGSFLVSRKVGFLTTFAILLHEIPHEVGDFAILLRAGFDRWSAARMQLSTALGGVLGACFALSAQSQQGAENATAWILPFSSGGFLYIALVNVVPDLLEETNPRHLLLQILLVFCGVGVMALLSAIAE